MTDVLQVTQTQSRERVFTADWFWWTWAASITACGLFFREFPIPTAVNPSDLVPSRFHTAVIAGFTPADVLILAFATCALLARLAAGRTAFSRRIPVVVFWAAVPIIIGIWVGLNHGSHSPYGDWKNLALGALYSWSLGPPSSVTTPTPQHMYAW